MPIVITSFKRIPHPIYISSPEGSPPNYPVNTFTVKTGNVLFGNTENTFTVNSFVPLFGTPKNTFTVNSFVPLFGTPKNTFTVTTV